MTLGEIVILNGVPRSGKSSIAHIIQDTFEGVWMNIGVDTMINATARRHRPGMGLRPGEPEHPVAAIVAPLYAAFWESIAAHSREGICVVADVGMHDATTVRDGMRRLQGLPVLFVAVRCPIDEIMRRRNEGDGPYLKGTPDDPVPAPVQRWQDAVHAHGVPYDLEVDTSVQSPQDCAEAIRRALKSRTDQ
jgi:chloramphenicol 3-O phosphotransferase